jgi:hypothetical protein
MFEHEQETGTSMSDDDVARAYVGQESLIEGEPLGAGQRTLLSLLGDTPEEITAAARKYLDPDLEILPVPDTGVVLFRKAEGENYRKVDKGFVEGLVNEGAVGELGRDTLEFLRVAPIVAIELRFGKGAGTFLKAAARMATGAMLGEAGMQKLQTTLGTQRQTLGEVLGSVGLEGITSVAGTTAGGVVGRGTNLGTRRVALIEPTQEGKEAFEASARLRAGGHPVEEPIPFQVVDVPIIKLFGRQSMALWPRLGRELRRIENALATTTKGLSNKSERIRLRHNVVQMVEKSSNDMLLLMDRALKHKPTDLPEAGRALIARTQDWWRTTGDAVSDLAARARAIEEPEFDLRPALNAVEDLSRGVRGAAKEELQQVGVDAAGKPIMEMGRGAPVRADKLPGPIADVIKRLNRLDPDMPIQVDEAGERITAPAMDVLRNLRSELSDLMIEPLEGGRREQALARKLYGAITEVMENPTNANPEFLSAWSAMTHAASKRFTTRELMTVREALSRDAMPSDVADMVLTPGPKMFERLLQLSRAGGKETLQPIKDNFFKRLVDDPFRITETLAQYDRRSLGILMTRGEQRLIRSVAEKFDAISQSGLRETIEQQTRQRPFIEQLVNNPSSAAIDALHQVINRGGGPEAAVGRSVRSSIMDQIWINSHKIQNGRRVLDGKKLMNTITDFKNSGVWDFLSREEQAIISDVKLMSRITDITADAGTSLMAASAAAGLRSFSVTAIQTILENFGVGRLMSSDAGRALVRGLGKTKPPLNENVFRMLGAAFATMAVDSRSSNKAMSEEDIARLERIVGTVGEDSAEHIETMSHLRGLQLR